MKKPTNEALSHNRPLEPSYIFKNNKVLILASLNDNQYAELLKILIQSDNADIKQ